MNNPYRGEHIVLSEHARSYIPVRGYEPDEVEQAIMEATWMPTERNRLDARMGFPFNKLWNGKLYGTKQVRPIFVVEGDTITVITVYPYCC